MGVQVPYIGYVVNQGGASRPSNEKTHTNKRNIEAVAGAVEWLALRGPEILADDPPGAQYLPGPSPVYYHRNRPVTFESSATFRSELMALCRELPGGFTLVVPDWKNVIMEPDIHPLVKGIWNPAIGRHQIEILQVKSKKYPLEHNDLVEEMGFLSYLQGNSTQVQIKFAQWRGDTR